MRVFLFNYYMRKYEKINHLYLETQSKAIDCKDEKKHKKLIEKMNYYRDLKSEIIQKAIDNL